jgi:hypothetical protein
LTSGNGVPRGSCERSATPITQAAITKALRGRRSDDKAAGPLGNFPASVVTAPMALLQPRRLLADEGLRVALRFAGNVLIHRDARKRVLTMRCTFRRHRHHLAAVATIARKP